jgi:hypothetical protein
LLNFPCIRLAAWRVATTPNFHLMHALFRLPFLSLVATALPLAAQNPASAAPLPTSSGRPASAAVTLKFDTAYTGDTPFAARGTSVGNFSVAQFGAEIVVPLPPVGGSIFPILSLRYRDYSLDRDTLTPIPDRLKSLSAAFTVSANSTPIGRSSRA